MLHARNIWKGLRVRELPSLAQPAGQTARVIIPSCKIQSCKASLEHYRKGTARGSAGTLTTIQEISQGPYAAWQGFDWTANTTFLVFQSFCVDRVMGGFFYSYISGKTIIAEKLQASSPRTTGKGTVSYTKPAQRDLSYQPPRITTSNSAP